MSQLGDSNTDFYIGWQEKAPQVFAKRSRRFVLGVLGMVLVTAALIVGFQKPFVGSTFEFGTISTIEGRLVMSPVPMIKTATQGVILVGFGKSGAEQTLAEIETEKQVVLEGKKVMMKGTRIYHDGKMAFELSEGVESFLKAERVDTEMPVRRQEMGVVTLKGEILDPKCALGVMMPGEGKPHRSCAIRCISGGVPPMLRIQNQAGQANYILVKGSNREAINQEVLPFVADQIQICGELVQEDDWLVLYTDLASNIVRISPYGAPTGITNCGS